MRTFNTFDTFRTAILVLVSVTASAQQATNDAVLVERLQQASAAISNGQLPQAESLLQSVLTNAPRDPDATNLLGVVRAQQHRNVEAEKLFRRVLTIAPTHVGAHVNLAELYLTTNRTQEAFQLLLIAHKLAPQRPDVNLRLATIYEGKNQYQVGTGLLTTHFAYGC